MIDEQTPSLELSDSLPSIQNVLHCIVLVLVIQTGALVVTLITILYYKFSRV